MSGILRLGYAPVSITIIIKIRGAASHFGPHEKISDWVPSPQHHRPRVRQPFRFVQLLFQDPIDQLQLPIVLKVTDFAYSFHNELWNFNTLRRGGRGTVQRDSDHAQTGSLDQMGP